MDHLFSFPNMTNTLQVVGCHFGVQPPGWQFPRHHHHLFELLCCLEGEVVQEMNRETILMQKGDWLLIKSGLRHQSSNAAAGDYGYFNVHFDLDDAGIRSLLAASPYRHIRREAAEQSKLLFYVSELEAVMRRSRSSQAGSEAGHQRLVLGFEDKLLLQSYTLLIIHDVLSLLQEHDQPKRQPEAEGASDVGRGGGTGGESGGEVRAVHDGGGKKATLFAADVAHAIEEKLSHGLCEEASVAGVAKALNLSRSQCSKLFSSVYGLSPRQYVSRQKLNLAKELLVTSNMPIGGIAEKLGFHSASHFSRQFRRWTGQSPTAFRPRHQSGGADAEGGLNVVPQR
ncbi:helix-turn-helix domain-containing protein [Paenibacillus aestuarii]|uniref:Helix-turn-helix domain-containing protein n=1 Tax=Paenibacillus aestuarii TaxID=516965 RepID=A0ABW0KAH6_9BACL